MIPVENNSSYPIRGKRGRLLPLNRRTDGGRGFGGDGDGDVQARRWRLSSREVAENGRKESGKPLEHRMAATDEGNLGF